MGFFIRWSNVNVSTFFFSLAISCSVFFAASLFAKPYHAEYRDGWEIIVFQGDIAESDEAKVRLYQTQYLESLHHIPGRRFNYKMRQFEYELNQLGVTVIHIPDDPTVPSEHAVPYFPPQSTNRSNNSK
jgi:hypothetical protein